MKSEQRPEPFLSDTLGIWIQTHSVQDSANLYFNICKSQFSELKWILSLINTLYVYSYYIWQIWIKYHKIWQNDTMIVTQFVYTHSGLVRWSQSRYPGRKWRNTHTTSCSSAPSRVFSLYKTVWKKLGSHRCVNSRCCPVAGKSKFKPKITSTVSPPSHCFSLLF